MFVPVKTKDQQSVMMLHKTRKLLADQKVMVRNAIRGHLAEFGKTAPLGRNPLIQMMLQTLVDTSLPTSAKAGLIYAPKDNLLFNLTCRYDKRNSNQPLFQYNETLATASVTYKIRP